MRVFVATLILLAGQVNILQQKPITRLQPHRNSIDPGLGGSVLELINAPSTVFLPAFPPKADISSVPWTIEVKNFGPNPVKVSAERAHFETTVSVGQTVQIVSNSTLYFLKR